MTTTYDAAKAAVDALERAMNGPDGCPTAVRTVLQDHAAIFADLAGQPLAHYRRTLAEAKDENLCPSAHADSEGRPFDPFDRAQRWGFAALLGDKAKDRLATLRHEATAGRLVAAASRLVQKITPGTPTDRGVSLPVAALSIVGLSDLLGACRTRYLAIDLGEAFRPDLAGGTSNVDDWGFWVRSGDDLVKEPFPYALVLDRLHCKQLLDLMRDQMTRSSPDAVFRARVVWEQIAPAKIVLPDSPMPFWLIAGEWTEDLWDSFRPGTQVQIVRMTIDDTEPAALHGPVQRIPPVYGMRLVLTWDEPEKGRARRGQVRVFGQAPHEQHCLGETVEIARAAPPSPSKPIHKPVRAGKQPTRKADAA